MLHWILALLISYLAGRWSVNQIATGHEGFDIGPLPLPRDWLLSIAIVLDMVLFWLYGWNWTWVGGVVLITYLLSLAWVS